MNNLRQKKYHFHVVDHCNMCNTDSAGFKILGKRLDKSQGFFPQRNTGISVTLCRCRNCGLIFPNPFPVPQSLNDHYGIDVGEYWDENYFSLSSEYFSGEIRWLEKLLEFKPGLRALDVGAGIGKTMLVLEKAGCEVVGLEPSETFRCMAIDLMNIQPGKIYQVPVEEAEFPDDFFDFITFSAVLEHLTDPAGMLRKTFKWLRNGGIIHVEVPNSEWLISKWINLQYKVRGLDYVSNLSPMHPPYHLYEFSLRSFQEQSLICGYEIADHGYYVCNTYLPRIFDFFIKPYMKWTDKGMQLVVWLRKP